MFQKSYTKRGRDIHIGRGCQINCRDDHDKGFYCCDGDFCNAASYLTSSVTLVVVPTVFCWLKGLLRPDQNLYQACQPSFRIPTFKPKTVNVPSLVSQRNTNSQNIIHVNFYTFYSYFSSIYDHIILFLLYLLLNFQWQ